MLSDLLHTPICLQAPLKYGRVDENPEPEADLVRGRILALQFPRKPTEIAMVFVLQFEWGFASVRS